MRKCQIDSYKLLLEKVVSERKYKTTVYWQIYNLYHLQMEKLLTKIIESWLIFNEEIYWHWVHEIVASNILESSIGETIVEWVCKWLLVIAEEEWKTLQEVVNEILEDSERNSL